MPGGGKACPPEEIGVFVRSEAEIPRARAAVEAAGLTASTFGGAAGEAGQAAVGTMHLAKPESTEGERMSGCGWVLRCSWDNGFARITSEPQGAPIRCYQRATPTG